MPTPKINLKSTDWQPGKVRGLREKTLDVVATGDTGAEDDAHYRLVFGPTVFLGVERVTYLPQTAPGIPAQTRVEHQPSSAVDRAQWKRIHRADERRRRALNV